MKKSVMLLLLISIVGGISAQHLRFEGIAIDGTITSFQSQLSAKGFKINSTKSKDAPVGQRIFCGKLHGYNAEITVYYARKSKIVYKVKAEIESEKQDVIQSILDKTLEKIDSKYIYTTQHEADDSTSPHFMYHIYPSKTSEKSTGTIEINPTHTYYYTGDENNPLEHAGFAIYFIFIDRANDDFVPPSEKEPRSSPNFTCEEPDNFRKYSEWMLGYMQNGCYERAILYVNWLLDYYKYDCIPYYVRNATGGDIQFDEIIRLMQEKCIGSIRTGVSRKWTKVYMVTDNETGKNFIEFDANFYNGLLWNHIKLDKYDVLQHIKSLDQLKQSFSAKEAQFAIQPPNDYWEEKTAVNLPASVGDEKRGVYGDLQWSRTNLMAYFSYHNDKLWLEITYDDEFQFVFRFTNIEQIESQIQFFKSINWE